MEEWFGKDVKFKFERVYHTLNGAARMSSADTTREGWRLRRRFAARGEVLAAGGDRVWAMRAVSDTHSVSRSILYEGL